MDVWCKSYASTLSSILVYNFWCFYRACRYYGWTPCTPFFYAILVSWNSLRRMDKFRSGSCSLSCNCASIFAAYSSGNSSFFTIFTRYWMNAYRTFYRFYLFKICWGRYKNCGNKEKAIWDLLVYETTNPLNKWIFKMKVLLLERTFIYWYYKN